MNPAKSSLLETIPPLIITAALTSQLPAQLPCNPIGTDPTAAGSLPGPGTPTAAAGYDTAEVSTSSPTTVEKLFVRLAVSRP